MRRLFLLAVTLFVCAAELPAQEEGRRRGSGRRRDRDVSSVVLTNITYQRVTFATESVTSKSANYGVYLPPGYDDPANASRKYPWIVWLHGMSEDDRDFHFGGAKVLDEQVGSGALPPLVFVAASAPSRTLYVNGEVEGNVRDLITKDLLAHVQATFRVSEKHKDRALMGVSLGGMAALRFAFTDPALFGAVATHSAATFPEDPAALPDQHAATVARFGERLGWYAILGNPIDAEKFAAVNPTSLAHHLGELHGLRIYFDAGSADRYGFGPANQHLDEVLTEAKVPHTFRLIEGGEHSWGGGTVQLALVESLKFVAAGFEKPAQVVPEPAGAGAGKQPGEGGSD